MRRAGGRSAVSNRRLAARGKGPTAQGGNMRWAARKILAFALLLLVGGSAFAQSGTPSPADTTTAPDTDGGPTGKESTVGYIDSALPRNTFRLRFDAAYDFERPTRAEFFWARTINPGVPRPETRVDYQDLSSYLE